MEAPLILSIETSGKSGGVCLFKEKPLCSISFGSRESYSKKLFSALEYLRDYENFSLGKLDFIVVDVGPGSFTGLRIGLSVVKAFCLESPELKVIPVSSLEVLAGRFVGCPHELVCVVNAYGGEVFIGIYHWEKDKLIPELKPCLLKVEKAKELVKSIEKTAIFLSETPELFRKYFKEVKKDLILPEELISLSPEITAKIGYLKYRLYKEKAFVSASELRPLYLKASEAERKSGLLLTCLE